MNESIKYQRHRVVFHFRTTQFSTTPRKVIIAKDSDGLRRALTKAYFGHVIQLCEGVYDGSFFNQRRTMRGITIQGLGPTKSIIQSSSRPPILRINSSNCTLKDFSIHSTWISKKIQENLPNLKILGDNNQLTNISISGGEVGVRIDGNKNTLNNLTIENSALRCLYLNGNSNIISNPSFNLSCRGCKIVGNENTLSDLNMTDVIRGLGIYGVDNTIKNVSYIASMSRDQVILKLKEELHFEDNVIKLEPRDYPCVVKFGKGKNNSVSHVRIKDNTELNWIKIKGGGDLKASIVFCPESKYCKINTCRGGGGWKVFVNGQYHSLIDVNGGPCLKVEGNGHDLDRCRASQLLKVGTNCIDDLDECTFSSVGQIIEDDNPLPQQESSNEQSDSTDFEA
jgi:hypothetical protein